LINNYQMDYEIVYKAENSYEAHFIKGLLKKHLIESKLLGENLSIGVGGLPVDVLQVDILVSKDQIKKTKKIISDYENNLSLDESKKKWKCPSCKNINPSSFEICWNCKE
tara:strand:- start:857 stop:1186 length:330 start_codon:yes stop_codon:yes gene_type:complete